jgi:pimeloyl-ACP methyl ester carboxylesterase
MSRVQEIEAAVGEDELLTSGARGDTAWIILIAATEAQNRLLQGKNSRVQKDLHGDAARGAKQNFRRISLSRGASAERGIADWEWGAMSENVNDLQAKPRMQKRLMFRALLGVALIVAGLLLVLPRRRHEKTFLIDAGGCGLTTTVIEPPEEARGTVILLHGLAANRKIMEYFAHGFAGMGLRVLVPDLPGHGSTGGAFSAARAEECSESLLHELRSRGMAAPESTILAGHSMGGAIAIRLAARVPVAGVIAISPAPMRAAHGVGSAALLYDDPPALAPFSEVISGGWEFDAMRGNAADLLQSERDVHSKYVVVPRATHASLLTSPLAMRSAQDWAAKALHIDGKVAPLPSRWPLLGAMFGVAGLLLLAGPFVREAAGKTFGEKTIPLEESTSAIPWWRAAIEIICVSAAVVGLLRYRAPVNAFRLFEGDYLTGFLLFVGVVLVALHWTECRDTFAFRSLSGLWTIFAAVVLFLLFSAWFELSLTEAWLDGARWQRFPLLFVAVLPWLMAEELVLGPLAGKRLAGGRARKWPRLLRGMFHRLLFWLALLAGIMFLHSGEMLLVLLAPYFLLFSILHRWGMDVVREVSGSAAAAALFGAILLAGFFLVIFPLH